MGTALHGTATGAGRISTASPLTSPGRSSSLLTDHYELTMLDAALRSGVAHHRATFECFARRLPPGRRYGVVAGTGRLIEELERFRFDGETVEWLRRQGFLSSEALEWLAGYRFSGTISGYREGELCFPGSPVLTVEGTFAEAVLLETLVLSVLNYDGAVAAAAARMAHAAAGRPLLEVGGRRTSEWAAPAAARAAYLCGFSGTSNLEAGRRWGVPTGGTTAHAFVLAHADERGAFDAQLALTGPATTLLVDTFDLEAGIRNAVAAAGPALGAVRIDSGDPFTQSRLARKLLDELGAHSTRIVLSGDLDEYVIDALVNAGAPVDRMLVGTQLVTGSGAPTAGLVYKLVAVADREGRHAPLHAVAKTSLGKATRGGRKWAGRVRDRDGFAAAELVVDADHAGALEDPSVRPLQVDFVRDGEVVARPPLEESRLHHRAALDELGAAHLELGPGEPALRASAR
jgi:nicotinate phosphoribosyltransferase